MRRPLALLALAAVAGLFLMHPVKSAQAADFYQNTLQPGADGGTLANLTGLPSGSQVMVRCTTHPVKYRLCQTGLTCTATSNDSDIDADQSIDICGLTGWTQISLFRTYDGGVPSCRIYTVNPSSPECRQ